jgi:hypothetical protein
MPKIKITVFVFPMIDQSSVVLIRQLDHRCLYQVFMRVQREFMHLPLHSSVSPSFVAPKRDARGSSDDRICKLTTWVRRRVPSEQA